MEIAEECCREKVILTLEGGYNVAGQTESVKQVLKELAGFIRTDTNALITTAEKEILSYVVEKTKRTHQKYWRSL
jgi:acetoin utilization deacetylase AcuC-like enzyme